MKLSIAAIKKYHLFIMLAVLLFFCLIQTSSVSAAEKIPLNHEMENIENVMTPFKGKVPEKDPNIGGGIPNITIGSKSDPGYINAQKQNRHIQGTKEYTSGKSIFNGTVVKATRLLRSHGGKGRVVNKDNNRESVNFNENIGLYRSPGSDAVAPTTVGTIHYSKTGAHIVPARPIQ
ncbi:polymorphic toxin type 50 domain-containing protein [Alkalihalobacillus sp. 1P02AB]|uniref:polymorphic toxin type 50 domain-containing protein n=1 Tax=Alkalihalobacillus sp. 1P02AB TaxID=3132260 RepID=UPI0039A74F53